MKQALEGAADEEIAEYTEKAQNGEKVLVKGFEEAYDPSIFTVMTKTKKGIVSAECQNKTVVALDVNLTEELIKEGAVRDVVRQCQLLRKEAGYEVEQRVVLSVSSASDFIMNVLKESAEHMKSELLADDIVFGGSIESDLEKTFDVGEDKVTAAVKKA